ncbi:MAG: hypothetical protein O2967_06010 [Proteobacteria bacterium]|nr:hypothetical protein [Pseudomonadota bacterium]
MRASVEMVHGVVWTLRRSEKPLLAAIRQSITLSGSMNSNEALAQAADNAVGLAGTENFREGARAFLDKRAPQWND